MGRTFHNDHVINGACQDFLQPPNEYSHFTARPSPPAPPTPTRGSVAVAVAVAAADNKWLLLAALLAMMP